MLDSHKSMASKITNVEAARSLNSELADTLIRVLYAPLLNLLFDAGFDPLVVKPSDNLLVRSFRLISLASSCWNMTSHKSQELI